MSTIPLTLTADRSTERWRRVRLRTARTLLVACTLTAGSAAVALAPATATAATSTTWYVSSTAASNPACAAASATVPFASIQAALNCAAAGDTVSVGAGTFTGALGIARGVTLSGAGAAKTTILAPSNGSTSDITVNSTLPVTIANLTVNGAGSAGPLNRGIAAGTGSLTLSHVAVVNTLEVGGSGAAVSARTATGSVNLTILDSTISGNQGEGIEVDGAPTGVTSTLSVLNSTIAGNSATTGSPLAGGIGVYNTQTILAGDTITGNVSPLYGGVNAAGNSTLSLTNVLLARNTGSLEADCAAGSGLNVTSDHSLIGADTPGASSCSLTAGRDGNLVGTSVAPLNPKLNPLASNGGPTKTIALQTGSPAIGAGNAGECGQPPLNGLDQRGINRGAGARFSCDIGAYDTAGGLGKTWYVSAAATSNPTCAKASASLAFHTIAAALACAHNSDTVAVGSGTFAGGFTVPANIVLRGAGATRTTIGNHTLTYPKATITVAEQRQVQLSGFAVDGTVNGVATNAGILSGAGQLTVTAVEVHGTSELTFGDNAAVSSSAGPGENSAVEILDSTISANFATYGSAVSVATGPGTPTTSPSTLLVANSTITSNSSTFEAGGVSAFKTAIRLYNDTINANTATSSVAAGVDIGASDTALLINTIIAGNTGPSHTDCGAAAGTVGAAYNVIGIEAPATGSCGPIDGTASNFVGTLTAPVNPQLSALTLNGGQTRTEAHPAASPETGTGDANTCLAAPLNGLDQRGVSRNAVARGTCDIGAYDTTATAVKP